MPQEHKVRISRIESKLDSLAGVWLLLSIVIFVYCIIYSQTETIQSAGEPVSIIIAGFLILLIGVMYWIIFQAGAEVIRLLKKLNRIPYSGTISGIQIDSEENEIDYECTDCHAKVSRDSDFCPKCGAKFE